MPADPSEEVAGPQVPKTELEELQIQAQGTADEPYRPAYPIKRVKATAPLIEEMGAILDDLFTEVNEQKTKSGFQAMRNALARLKELQLAVQQQASMSVNPGIKKLGCQSFPRSPLKVTSSVRSWQTSPLPRDKPLKPSYAVMTSAGGQKERQTAGPKPARPGRNPSGDKHVPLPRPALQRSKRRSHRQRTKRDALILTPSSSASNGEILCLVTRSQVDRMKKIAEKVSSTRWTAKGDILLELTGAEHDASKLMEDIGSVPGDKISIQATIPQSLFVVRDLDELASGEELAEALAEQSGLPINSVTVRSFRLGRFKTQTATVSVPTSQATLLAKLFKCTWELSEVYTASDHAVIFSDLAPHLPLPSRPARSYKAGTLNVQRFSEGMESLTISGAAEKMTEDAMRQLHAVCGDCMQSRRPHSRHREPVLWWNRWIADARSDCVRARRRYQRSYGTPCFLDKRLEYQACRRALKPAIRASKSRCFLELCDSADHNPLGSAYKTVVKRITCSRQLAPLATESLRRIVDHLFPRMDVPSFPHIGVSLTGFATVTVYEVLKAAARVKESKAAGPDNIPNRMPARRRLSAQMKTAASSTAAETRKASDDPASLRPICLIDGVGKVLEHLIGTRLQEAIRVADDHSDTQFCFRKAKSTVDAIAKVVDIAKSEIACKRWKGGSKEYCLVVTLDIRNAFNTVRWDSSWRL
ncbi:hypothetical protein KR054_006127 [Drosophila jambulina]|nr:hypothetical protein KR054_006127 [Drosophila jambulina]